MTCHTQCHQVAPLQPKPWCFCDGHYVVHFLGSNSFIILRTLCAQWIVFNETFSQLLPIPAIARLCCTLLRSFPTTSALFAFFVSQCKHGTTCTQPERHVSAFGAATTLHTPCRYMVSGAAASRRANRSVLSDAVTADG